MKYLIGFFILILLVIVATALLFDRIPPASIGVKQVVLGPDKGIVTQDYPTGLVLALPGYHRWSQFPRQTHFLHFTGGTRLNQNRSVRGIEDWQPPLDIRTTDNNNVTIDATLTYRIMEGEAHKIAMAGLRTTYRDRVRSLVLDVLRAELAKLTSEDLQLPEKRIERSRLTKLVLAEELAKFHVEPEDLLIRAIRFLPQYEEKLQQKQLLRQQSKLAEALTQQAEEDQKVQTQKRKIAAAVLSKERDWDRKIQAEKSSYQVMIATIAAEADLYDKTTRAEGEAERDISIANGTLLIEQSKALRDDLRNVALDSEGGRILLALQAVTNLNIPEVILNSDDPAVPMLLDLSQMTELLVGTSPPIPGLNQDD
ncbi:MAG: SPFH domain-containing protein [Planctomycetota bacterium]